MTLPFGILESLQLELARRSDPLGVVLFGQAMHAGYLVSEVRAVNTNIGEASAAVNLDLSDLASLETAVQKRPLGIAIGRSVLPDPHFMMLSSYSSLRVPPRALSLVKRRGAARVHMAVSCLCQGQDQDEDGSSSNCFW